MEQLGRYEILDKLGQGGFAIVYRGRDIELDRQVALKELRPTLLQDESWIKRFRREARTIAQLDHPHVVPIYDVYEAQDRLFIVMRLVEGVSLEDLIVTRSKLSWAESLEMITAVANGLDYAHAQGILHRDLKPANILIDDNRGPMLSDFGLAKLTGEASMSASESVVGTPHYIAPEVWEGEKASRQSDIYALGCILFEMVTGDKVFKGDTPPAVMMAHFKAPELPSAWPPDVPPNLTQVLNTALARRPAERYKTATEMVQALSALDTGVGAVPSFSSDDTMAIETQAAQTDRPTPPPESQPSVTPPELQQPAPQRDAAPATPVLQPEPSPPPVEAAPKKNRSGCLWVGIGGAIALLFLIVFGIGTFCSTIGTTIDTAMAPIETGETVTEEINVTKPDTNQTINLTIDYGFGELIILPAQQRALVEGTATYNAGQLKPKVTANGTNIHLQPETNIGLSGFTTPNLENRWDLTLAMVPMNLTLNVGGAESEIELGGLPLEGLTIGQGAAGFDLSFSEANPIEMGTFKFGGGASNTTLTGLANARAEELDFDGGAGNYTLDFAGELQNDLDVSIEAGLGAITIIVPENTAAEVTFEGAMANLDNKGAWQQSGEQYVLPGSEGSGYKITFDIKMGPGSVELRTE